MLYRTLPHGGEHLSVLGLGSGGLHNASDYEIEATVEAAIEAGVNLFDFIPSRTSVLAPLGRALGRNRRRVHVQVHIGAEYTGEAYGWTTNGDLAKREFEARLRALGSDYADFGFIHCIDEEADLARVIEGGIWEFALEMRRQGVIRHLAFSTHSVSIARRLLVTAEFDLAMFSINPLYDYTDDSPYGKGETSDRAMLYREFEQAGVGVSVMKAFAGGQLLDGAASPLGVALTRAQCIQYALDRPGVVSVLPGVRGMDDLRDMLAFLDATEAQRDYSAVGELAPRSEKPACVYCNHCMPCPRGIEIGLANKYYDLARQGDELAVDHYANLGAHAGDCVACGHCDARCPFGVPQSARMAEIAAYFDA